MTRSPWAVLAAVALANLVVAALHFGLAAAAPLLRSELALSSVQLGVVLAAPPMGLMLGTYGWGVLADRLSERRVLTGAFTGFSVSTLAAAWAFEAAAVSLMAVALLGSGAFGSAAHSAGGRAITAAFPPERQGFVLSIRHTAIPIGAAIGGAVVPLVGTTQGLGLVLVGAAALGAGSALVLGIWIPSSRAFGVVDRPVPTGGSPLRVRAMWLLAIGAGSLAFVQLGIGSFLTLQLVDEAGLSLASAALIFTVAQLLGAGGRVVLGIISDRVRSRVSVLIAVAVSAAALVQLSIVLSSPITTGMALAGALVIVTSCNGVVVAVAASLAPAGRTGATLGMQTTANAFACSIAPITLGLVLAAGGWNAIGWVLLSMLALSLAGLATLRRGMLVGT